MPTNPFIDSYLPFGLWPAEVATFGTRVLYLPQGDPSRAVLVSVLWKDGRSDEDVTPGRYSHIDVLNSDLPAFPAKRDKVQKDGKQYLVVAVDALITRFSVLVLDEIGAVP